MKNIYECYEIQATDEFSIIHQHDVAKTVLWMAPESGTHDVTPVIRHHDINYLHFMLVPENCNLQGLLWQMLVDAKQPPNTIGMVGNNVILEESYTYGMCVRV